MLGATLTTNRVEILVINLLLLKTKLWFWNDKLFVQLAVTLTQISAFQFISPAPL